MIDEQHHSPPKVRIEKRGSRDQEARRKGRRHGPRACHRCAQRGNANLPVYCAIVIALRRRGLALVLWSIGLITGANASAQRAAPAPPSPDTARAADAHLDRVLLVPTAETHPEGTLFITVYELILPSIGYAITDDLQASVFGFTDFESGVLELRVKANVLRAGLVRVALATSLDYLTSDPDELDDPAAEHDFLLGRADAMLQLCFDARCRSSLSSAVTVAASAQNELVFPVALGTGVTIQGSPLLTLLLEYGAIVNAADDVDLLPLPLHVVSYGVRFTWSRSWALDVALARALNPQRAVRTTEPELFDVLGVPLIALSYRASLVARSSTTYP